MLRKMPLATTAQIDSSYHVGEILHGRRTTDPRGLGSVAALVGTLVGGAIGLFGSRAIGTF